VEYSDLKKEDRCLVHRYLYYVMDTPIISDYIYDAMEREARKFADENHPILKVGSSLAKDYPEHIVNIAKKELSKLY
jgi:NAD-dependent DNA ligase